MLTKSLPTRSRGRAVMATALRDLTSEMPKGSVCTISGIGHAATAIEQREPDEEGPRRRATPNIPARGQPTAKVGKRPACGQGEPTAANDLGGDQRAQSVSRALCHHASYPAQQDSLATSFVKVWAASFNPSTVVR
jgi:hypothetical protein